MKKITCLAAVLITLVAHAQTETKPKPNGKRVSYIYEYETKLVRDGKLTSVLKGTYGVRHDGSEFERGAQHYILDAKAGRKIDYDEAGNVMSTTSVNPGLLRVLRERQQYDTCVGLVPKMTYLNDDTVLGVKAEHFRAPSGTEVWLAPVLGCHFIKDISIGKDGRTTQIREATTLALRDPDDHDFSMRAHAK